MQIVEQLAAFLPQAYPRPVLALGNFDGVHRGHQAIFQHVIQRARDLQGTSMVFTFEPHPLQVLAPEKAPALLTTADQKMRLIAALGVQVGLCIPFTETFARQEPLAFIQETLCACLGIHEVVVGHDFRFGHRRAGTVDLLQEQAGRFGYQVTVIPAIMEEGIIVSSSNIRRLLLAGEVAQVTRLLGRPYAIAGPVVEGFRRGRQLGFPTANVRPAQVVVPARGVYAVQVEWNAQRYPGVANVGYNPTFGNDALSIEAHLFDMQADLYGAMVRIEFCQRIRDERKFTSREELAAQIACDAEQARRVHAASL
ncbi:MAG: bifunctional riboflavin kinase/FAD synthetase [Candidatus Tectomicrobia bacterium]|uniref:Riboflavin biosynthesis protein n=1 Tax=Tectimicrobiota bacterium TaxID=2528274 RepID=A0A937VZJ8_UNCTE|nr:bifunctional riboflavin kinase/FAD synthetase [Candidatus Tectomicrobia bacterium]